LSSRASANPAIPFYQIYVLDLDVGDVERISPGHGKTTCAFFHPGHRDILFSSTHHDPESKALQEEELDFRASGRSAVTRGTTTPRWRSTSTRRAHRHATPPDDARGYDAEASYSPDGEWIAFSSTRDAYNRPLSEAEQKQLELDPSYFGEIYIMKADGSGQTSPLTDTPGYDGGPFFSPDGPGSSGAASTSRG
jgi:hypothetical protein